MNYRHVDSTFRLEVEPFTAVTLQVVADADFGHCERCFFKDINCASESISSQLGPCTCLSRRDKTDIHFVKVTLSDYDC